MTWGLGLVLKEWHLLIQIFPFIFKLLSGCICFSTGYDYQGLPVVILSTGWAKWSPLVLPTASEELYEIPVVQGSIIPLSHNGSEKSNRLNTKIESICLWFLRLLLLEKAPSLHLRLPRAHHQHAQLETICNTARNLHQDGKWKIGRKKKKVSKIQKQLTVFIP